MSGQNDGTKKREVLLAGLLADTLTEREEEELLSEIGGDEEFADEVRELFKQGRLLDTVFHMKRDDAFVDKVLACVEYSDSKTAFVEKVSRRVEGPRRRAAVRPSRWPLWTAVAACLAIAAGLVWYGGGTPEGPSAVARIRTAGAGVRMERDGAVVAAAPGSKLFSGDRLRTGKGQEAAFVYDRENTEIWIADEAEVVIGPVEKGARLEMNAGVIRAVVAPRPPDGRLTVVTPHARAEVMGTKFQLAVDEKTTRLDVFEGTVRLADTLGGTSIDVAAGSSAVAGRGVRLAARPTDRVWIPGFDEHLYDEGRAILEDGFENGLDNWEVVVSGPGEGEKFVPAGAAAQEYAAIVEKPRDGGKTRCLRLQVPEGRQTRVGVRLKNRVTSPAYVITWETSQPTGAETSPVCPGATDYQRLYAGPPNKPRVSANTWFSRRFECRPVGQAKGKSFDEIRQFTGNVPASRYLLSFDHGEFILELSAGQALFDNVTVRELVPVEKP